MMTLLRFCLTYFKACLQSLSFPEMDFRKNDIFDPANNTCTWFSEHHVYLKWSEQEYGLLWIKGKPGAGKSTLLKYALGLLEQDQDKDSKVASFFFHGRGELIEKSPLGLFRALLHQLALQIPDILAKLTSLFKMKCETLGDFGDKWTWHEKELQRFFDMHVTRVAERHKIRMYIDALDECGEEAATNLIEFFEGIAICLSVCFSCRHFPILALENGLEINVEHENAQDIETYINRTIGSGIQQRDVVNVARKEILNKSLGIFQWVVLVVRKVIKLHKNGKSLKYIGENIQSTPSELDALYQELLDNFEEDDLAQSLHLIQWICFALRPLSLVELRFAMVADEDSPGISVRQCQDTKEYAETDEEMERRVHSLSRGLAEIVVHDKHRVAQFIHQFVNDFLLRKGLELLGRPSPGSVIGRGHFWLLRSCIKYLAMEEIQCGDDLETEVSKVWGDKDARDNLVTRFQQDNPFLKYATESWIPHAEKVEEETLPRLDRLAFFNSPSKSVLQNWIKLLHVIKSPYFYFYDMHYSHGANMLHIASSHKLLSVIHALLGQGFDVNSKNVLGQTPLTCAAFEGHEAVVQVLLERGAETDSKDNGGRMPLSFAAELGREGVVKLLLERSDIEVNSKDEDGQTPLTFAAGCGRGKVVKSLLERSNVEADPKDSDGRTPLSYAAEEDSDKVVKLLLERSDVEADSKDENCQTPLSHATEQGREKVVKLLLERSDVEADLKDRLTGRTPLSYAAEDLFPEVVKLLLEQEAEVNAVDESGRTPLDYAVWSEGITMGREFRRVNIGAVKMLQEKGAISKNAAPLSHYPRFIASSRQWRKKH